MKALLTPLLFLSLVVCLCYGARIPTKKEYLKLNPSHVSSYVESPLPWMNPSDLPSNWDWRNVNGTNYVTPILNQHVPQYCGSCWAHGTVSSLSDRMKIQRKAQYPEVILSRQVLLNCGVLIGSCDGGFPPSALEYIKHEGIPDESCMPYVAVDLKCDDIGVCRNCDSSGCWGVKNFRKYYVKEFGELLGAEQMKSEIVARGPIICGMAVTDKFMNYTGGIYSEFELVPFINHIVSIVGFGKDDASGEEFWIVRNSWGSYWGEDGYFRIVMHKDFHNLGIETFCQWGTIDMH